MRYRAFDTSAHLNQLAERWLREEPDRRKHGTVQDIVAKRFAREQQQLQRLQRLQRLRATWHEPRTGSCAR